MRGEEAEEESDEEDDGENDDRDWDFESKRGRLDGGCLPERLEDSEGGREP